MGSALAEDAVKAVMDALAAHRWKSMGVASVECECGTILYGDEHLTQFSADEAFRNHLATVALSAAVPLLRADAYSAGRQLGAKSERERIRNWLAGEIILNGPFPDGVTERIGPAFEAGRDTKENRP